MNWKREKTGKIINVKKAQFLAPWDMKNVIDKVEASGNKNILLCERGTSFGYNRLVVDMTGIAEMKKFLDEKFNVNTVVVDYSCEKTDTEAEMYDTAMLEKYDMHGGRNVIISKKTLLRMKKDGAFRQKVYKSIEDIPWTSKLTGGEVKGNGVFIHEDGTGGYYLEFDWGDDDEKTKSKKSKVLYSDSSGVKKLDIPVLGERNNIGLQTDILISLMGANFSYKRKSNDAGF